MVIVVTVMVPYTAMLLQQPRSDSKPQLQQCRTNADRVAESDSGRWSQRRSVWGRLDRLTLSFDRTPAHCRKDLPRGFVVALEEQQEAEARSRVEAGAGA